MKKVKKRRRAVHAELVRESKDNPGYFRYNITIRETDGREHIVPAYGYDMQDAIKRLVRVERGDKISEVYTKKIEPITIIVMVVAWIFSVIMSLTLNDYKYAFWSVISIFSFLTIYTIVKFIRDLW